MARFCLKVKHKIMGKIPYTLLGDSKKYSEILSSSLLIKAIFRPETTTYLSAILKLKSSKVTN